MKHSKLTGLMVTGAVVTMLVGLVTLTGLRQSTSAATTKSGAVGVQTVIPGSPPSRGATIAVPGNGTSFTTTPITVSGVCPTGLLVKVFANNIFVGSVVCSNGSYSLQVDLFGGRNDLVARVYDALDQAGPDSNTVSVTFSDAQFVQFGSKVSLSSVYAQRGAPPGTELEWPVELSGGTGPYAVSIDWGDGSPTDLFSQASSGTLRLKHIYKIPGIYRVIVKVTDSNGSTAFLQLVGQATGAIQDNKKGRDVITEKEVLWWPALTMLPLMLVSFWIGRKYEISALHKKFKDSI